jgi:flavin-dependent dehydrogenase
MHDVAIIGGGLAGLSLALQVSRIRPDLSIVVIERDAFPAPVAAHKVGEATVEIGAHYLAHTLGLENYLEKQQLRKFGLRLFFGAGQTDDLATADELGASSLLPAISYQLDRGLLENDLADMLREAGVEVRDGAHASGVEIDGDDGHTLKLADGDSIRCRWLVDASGRSAVLKRTLKLRVPSEHRMCAAWFRVDSDFTVDDWSADKEWRARCGRASRRPSTNHLMGSGYWVWIIPLVGGRTSIGLVADPAIHPPDSFDTFEKMMRWFGEHQPLLARELEGTKPLDFLKIRNLSHGCVKPWSADRWALTGEAGFFADPFYSPGTDFIALSNTFVADLITRDCPDAERGIRAAVYEKLYRSFYESTMSLYEGQYAGFGDARLMAVKLTWDYCYYWSVLAWLYFREVLTDLDFLRRIQPDIERTRTLNAEMQQAFREHAAEAIVDTGRGRFFDQLAIPLLVKLNAALLVPAESPIDELRDNCARLDTLASKLRDLLAGKPIGDCELLGDLERRIDASVPCSRLRA